MRDPEIRYTNSQLAVATFTIAIDRYGKKDETDFIRIKVFGKSAENCERFLAKGRLVGIQGSIQTGNYKDKDGRTVYTTDVVASRVEFLEWGDKKKSEEPDKDMIPAVPEVDQIDFATLDVDLPF